MLENVHNPLLAGKDIASEDVWTDQDTHIHVDNIMVGNNITVADMDDYSYVPVKCCN